MKTEILTGAPGIEAAAALLAEGQVVALPTETVYGLAGHALDPRAAARIFEAKERPFFDPLITHLPALEWLDRLTTAADDSLVRTLVDRFWPGPLTMVLPRRPAVPDIVTSGLPTVAVRMSAHPLFRAVLERFGRPVAAPSANRFGRISPTAAAHVMEELGGRIPLILDGGSCAHGVESTVIAPRDGKLHLLRAGPVTIEELSAIAPVIAAAPGAIESPGQLESHYAPGTRMRLLSNVSESEAWVAQGRVGLLAWRRAVKPPQFSAMEVLTPGDEPREAAANLFAAMRRLDALGLDLIVAEPPPADAGLCAAIADRLRKAAAR
ncbi:MAG TPA: L-threonylcarbamoyladenylate synthase [Chthoniobacteraceae bacterium]|nr:L-threonylcarbamoyladenylate synthase [Chthoniobacteraceae bacterium]